jgi:ABC-type dipeptide/oligopeptide/nickel transport system permease component
LIASLFFILMAWGLGSVVGGASRGVGHLLGNLSTNSTILANSPSVQDTINQAIGSHSLKSSPSEVAKELSVRLIKGDSESAKRYYAYQTGLSDAEANTKVEQMKNDFEAALRQAGEVAAKAMAAAGWTLFVIFLLGLIAAVLGGRLGAHANLERPIVRYTTLDETGSALPYVLGWFMGVPISVLFLIFALRSC